MRPTDGDPAELLTPSSATGYLAGRGLIGGGAARVEMLAGGVSNVVLAVTSERGRIVVKQSLERLRVSDEWIAPRERILTEAAALRWMHGVTPAAVPAVLDVDPDRFVLVLEAAPATWSDWRALLLSGDVDPRVAGQLGRTLGKWQSAGRADPGLTATLPGTDGAFASLRLDPYHETTAARRPELADAIRESARLLRRGNTIVHGDFSPKNVLVGSDGVWVIDAEVAHRGNSWFDVAFLLSHLVLKSIHRPEDAGALAGAARTFMESYRTAAGIDDATGLAELALHTGALLAARVDGKSPAPYLTAGQRETTIGLAEELLRGGSALDDWLGQGTENR